MKKVFILLSLVVFGLMSCNDAKQDKNVKPQNTESIGANTAKKEVSYTKGENYFVKNTFQNKQVESIKIECQKEFDKIFGPAATMGENGKPTPIDFEQSFVIAVIGVPTDKETIFDVLSLKDRGSELELIYNVEQEDEKQSYTIHPFFFIIVDQKDKKDVKFIVD